jgi:hypothetical protein
VTVSRDRVLLRTLLCREEGVVVAKEEGRHLLKERRENAIVFFIIVNMPVKSFEKRIGPVDEKSFVTRYTNRDLMSPISAEISILRGTATIIKAKQGESNKGKQDVPPPNDQRDE